MVEKQSFVYIMASKKYGTLYTGVTSGLLERIYQHKNKVHEGFTKQYSVTTLVWYEQYENMLSAIKREKQIKSWNRLWKIEVIESMNPEWKSLEM
jgi:putative endonuclease